MRVLIVYLLNRPKNPPKEESTKEAINCESPQNSTGNSTKVSKMVFILAIALYILLCDTVNTYDLLAIPPFFIASSINWNTLFRRNKLKLTLLIIFGIGLALSIVSIANYPLLLLLFMILISVIPFLASIPQSWAFSAYRRTLIEAFINLIVVCGLYKQPYHWHIFLNYRLRLTWKGFKLFTILLGIFFLLYLCLARYILYLKIEYLEIPFSLYLIFYVMSFSIMIRGITSFTFFLIPYIIYNYPHHLEVLHMGPEMPPDIPQTPVTPIVRPVETRFGGFINKHTHYHQYHNAPPELPRISMQSYNHLLI